VPPSENIYERQEEPTTSLPEITRFGKCSRRAGLLAVKAAGAVAATAGVAGAVAAAVEAGGEVPAHGL
jgi:hypothetical protein